MISEAVLTMITSIACAEEGSNGVKAGCGVKAVINFPRALVRVDTLRAVVQMIVISDHRGAWVVRM